MMKFRAASNISFITVLTVLTTGCASTHGSPHGADITLIRLKPNPARIALTASSEGSLVVRKGCVYFVAKESKASEIPLWPPSYELWRSNGKVIGVMDTATGKSLRFGENAIFGGGDANHDLSSELEAPIPPACDGTTAYLYFSDR